MEAYDILAMTLEELTRHDTSWEAEASNPYTTEVELDDGGAYFDASFGNYLPDDPTSVELDVYSTAEITLYCDGVPFARGEWELPEDYFGDNIEFDDGEAYIPDNEGQVALAVEEFMASDDDAAIVLADAYYEPEICMDYFGDPGMTVGEALRQSSLFLPLG
jgi:hypothetical protein